MNELILLVNYRSRVRESVIRTESDSGQKPGVNRE